MSIAITRAIQIVAIIVGLALGSLPVLPEDKKPTTLFGITLGEPFPYAVHECAQGLPIDKTPCWQIGLMKDYPPELVNVPYEGARISLTSADHRPNGPVSSLTTSIAEPYCEESLNKLTAKFGKPVSDETIPMQNGFGATWTARMVHWNTNDQTSSEIDFAMHISSPEGCLLKTTIKAYRDAPENKTPKLSSF